MILKLVTVKEYCKINNITDAGVRKQIKSKNISHCNYNNITYLVIEDNIDEVSTDKIKLLNSKIQTLRAKLKASTRDNELISELQHKILKLELRNEKLEDKLEQQYEKKEELYEKVIGHMSLLEDKSREP